MLYKNVLESIGHTPIIRLHNLATNVFVKCEEFNPGGSVKTRPALNIIETAEKEGALKPGMCIIEATSGNTGIGLALVGAFKGYKVICFMPENMSEERRKIITAFGGEIIFTAAEGGLKEAVKAAEEMKKQDPDNIFIAHQFSNPRNPESHYKWTAPEIWEDMEGKVDVFVAGVGSGGTLQGIGAFLKERNPDVRLVAVEPKNSAALLGREPGLHQIQGIGDGFIPEVLDVDMIDMVVTVTDEQAVETARNLARKEGLLVGTSSGANVWAAIQLANGSNRVVTVLPDRAERYFSTSLI